MKTYIKHNRFLVSVCVNILSGLFVLMQTILFQGCSSNNCPLERTVTCNYQFYDSDGQSISDDTITSYLDVLNRLYVIEDMPAWNPNLRSKAAIRTSATRYYVDPSIAAAALGIAPKDLINDLRTFGFLFETMAVRDIRVYADALRAKVFHFRDSNGLECDIVIHRRDGSYGLVEIKLGGPKNIEQAAANLLALANTIDTEKMAAPSFMMVIIAVGPYAYRRKDGVYVVPLACLRP